MTTPVPPSVDDLLDAGSEGLLFFEAFLPLVGASGAPMSASHVALCARYDEQRGLDTDALRADADRLSAAAADARAEITRQSEATDALQQAWTGNAADAALDVLRRLGARSSAHVDLVEAVGSAMARASAGLHAVIEDKSLAASDFRADEVGGRNAAQVAAMVAGAGGASTPDAVRTLASVFPGLEAALMSASDPGRRQSDVVEPVAAQCREWLDTVFVPTMTERVAAFEHLCAATESAVSEIYAALSAAVTDIDESSWPGGHTNGADGTCDCPPTTGGGVPTAPAAMPAAPAASSPATVHPPLSAGPPVPAPFDPQPSVSQPTASPTAATGPSALADLMVRAVREAVTEVVSDMAACAPVAPAQSPLPVANVTDEQPAGPDTSGERGHLEAEVAGRGVRIDLEEDGTVDIRTHDAGGQSHHLTLAAGPLGLPVLTEVAEGPEPEPATQLEPAPGPEPAPQPEHVTVPVQAAESEQTSEPPPTPEPVPDEAPADPTSDCDPPPSEPVAPDATETGPPQQVSPGGEAAAADALAQPELAEAGPL